MTITRSKRNLSGDIGDYLLERVNRSRNNGRNSDNMNIQGQQDGAGADIGSLIALMTQNISRLTEINMSGASSSSSSNPAVAERSVIQKIENCPLKRSGTSLDAWTAEVLLWDECNEGVNNEVIVKKYLKFNDSVRQSENFQELQNLVEVEFVENQS